MKKRAIFSKLMAYVMSFSLLVSSSLISVPQISFAKNDEVQNEVSQSSVLESKDSSKETSNLTTPKETSEAEVIGKDSDVDKSEKELERTSNNKNSNNLLKDKNDENKIYSESTNKSDGVKLYELKDAVIQDGFGYSQLLLQFKSKDIYFDTEFQKFQNAIKSYRINGVEFVPTEDNPIFELDFDGLLADDTKVTDAANLKQPIEVIITLKDGREVSVNKSAVDDVKRVPLTDKLPDGEYTIGFRALKADGKPGSSMLEGFFDRNIHLIVKDGKYTISMLNLFFADSLYDFRIKTKEGFLESKKEDYGKPDKDGKYKQAIFTMTIDDVTHDHEGRVLVGYMGSSPEDKGDVSKYTPLIIKFKNEAIEGWQGYYNPKQQELIRKQSDDVLRHRLILSGVDKNKDSVISPEELQNFKGVIDISGTNSKDRIYDISILKDMGPGVTALIAGGNKIESIPEGLFDKATGLQKLDLHGNSISSLPSGIFDNATLMYDLQLSGNPIGKLPEHLLDKNVKLKRVTLTDTKISAIPKGFFDNNSMLQELHLSDNNLKSLDNDLFKNNLDLRWIYIDHNELRALPKSISNLTKMTVLYASFNKLEQLPEGMENLTSLNEVVLSENRIKEIPTSLFVNIAKNTSDKVRTSLKFDRNEVRNIPIAEILKNGKISRMDVALNYLPANMPYSSEQLKGLGISTTSQAGYFPQKTEMDLNIQAKDGNISVTRDLDILSMTFWWIGGDIKSLGGDGVSQSREAFDAYQKKKMTNGIADYMKNHKNYTWKIDTTIYRLSKDGERIPLATFEDTEKEDSKELTAVDTRMTKGDTYEVIKSISRQKGAGESYEHIFSITAQTVATSNAKVSKKIDLVEGNLIKADGSNTKSMASNALVNPIKKITTEGNDLVEYEVSFQPIHLFNLDGHLIKLYWYDETGKIFDAPVVSVKDGIPETFLIKAKADKNRIKLRVRVDAMEEIASSNENYQPGDGEQDVYLDLKPIEKDKFLSATDSSSNAKVVIAIEDVIDGSIINSDNLEFSCKVINDQAKLEKLKSKAELVDKDFIAYDMTLLRNEEPVEFKKANVVLNLSDEYANRKGTLYYLNANNSLEKVEDVSLDSNAIADITVHHFSTYLLAFDKKEDVQPELSTVPELSNKDESQPKADNSVKGTQDDTKVTKKESKTLDKSESKSKSTPKTGDEIIFIYLLSILSIGNFIYFRKKFSK